MEGLVGPSLRRGRDGEHVDGCFSGDGQSPMGCSKDGGWNCVTGPGPPQPSLAVYCVCMSRVHRHATNLPAYMQKKVCTLLLHWVSESRDGEKAQVEISQQLPRAATSSKAFSSAGISIPLWVALYALFLLVYASPLFF